MPNAVSMGQKLQRYGHYWIFNDGGSPPSWIRKKMEILSVGPFQTASMRNRAKFRADHSNHCRDIAMFGFLRMAASAILDFLIFKFITVRTVKRVELRHHAKFRQLKIAETAAQIWRLFNFQNGGRRHLGFLKLQISMGRVVSVELRHFAKFRGDRSYRCRNIVIFGFFKMAAPAILHF